MTTSSPPPPPPEPTARRRRRQLDDDGELLRQSLVTLSQATSSQQTSASLSSSSATPSRTPPATAAPSTARRVRKNQRAAASQAASTQGTQAANGTGAQLAGIIREANLVNFLTHDNLTVQFIPKINFLNGANGSGKSAVLASLMIGLGARATTTGRGQRITGLIQDGKTYCTITIKLANEGHDAYKPEIYGHTIIIMRRIAQGGASTYSIRNHANVEITKRRSELSAITDHFNIMTDNSLTFLTQDAAKEFLMNVKDADLYKFFAHGADITQTKDTYAAIGQELTSLCTKLQLISNSLEALKEKRAESKRVYHELKHAEAVKEQLAALDTEADWCQVADMEETLDRLTAKAADEAHLVQEAQDKLADEQAKVAMAVERLEQARADANVPFEAGQLEEAQHALAPLRQRRTHASREIKTIEAEMARTREKLEDARATLAEVERRDSGEAQAERARKQAQVEAMRLEIAQMHARVTELDAQGEACQARRPALDARVEDLSRREQAVAADVRQAEGLLISIEQAAANKLNQWGTNMAQLLDAIHKTRWRGETPLGPLGRYVKPKPEFHDKWLNYLRATIGPGMKDFVVSCKEDRAQLQQLFNDFQQRESRIIITDMRAQLDLRGYLPDSRFLTALDTLDISDPTAKRVLCINQQVEQRILIEKRHDAEHVTRNGWPPNSVGVFLPSGYRVGTAKGGLQMQAGPVWRGDKLCPFGLTGVHSGGPRNPEDLRRAISEKKQAHAEIQHELAQAREELDHLIRTAQQITNDRAVTDRRIRPMQRDMLAIEESLRAEEPVEVATIMAQIQELQEQLAQYQAQLPAAHAAQQTVIDELTAMEARVAELRDMRDRVTNYAAERQENIRGAERSVREFQRRVEHWVETIRKHEQMRDAAEHQRGEQQAILDEALAALMADNIVRPLVIRTREQIEHLRDQGTRTLNQIYARNRGLDFAMAERLHEEAKAKHMQAKSEHYDLSFLVDKLRQTLTRRASSFDNLVTHLSAKAATAFRQRMAKRGFAGELTFDHEKGLLHITANKLDANAERSMRTYSGGEKSFSTVCLLLALWDAMPTPIRALDEFDVYMDEVNRRITMELLIDAAKKGDSQFMFITPLSIANLQEQDDPDISIVFLDAPQRNNV